ncbi:MAG: hypothetical protein JJE44_09725 [Flavobacteriaceae bacterium]|nr:hypothetical protein [Flavobacteriaceae bacterium]
MKKNLLIGLIIIAIAMIIISISAKTVPPGLTGIGFIIIAILFYEKKI